MGTAEEEMASDAGECLEDRDPALLTEAAKKCLESQRKLIDYETNSNIRRSSNLDAIFREFKSASEVWEEGIKCWMESLLFRLGDFIPKFDEITKSNVDKIKNIYCESAHVFLVIFTGLVNLQNLRTESEKWKTLDGIAVSDLTKTAIAAFRRCIDRIPIDASSIVELQRELNNSIWYCERLWKKRGYKGDPSIASFHKRMETTANLLVDNILAVLLHDQVRAETDVIDAILMSDEPDEEVEAAWIGVDRMSTLRSCSQDWDGDPDVVRISTSLLYVIPRDSTRIHYRELGYVGVHSTNRMTNMLLCRSIVQHCFNLSHTKDEILVRVLILKNMAKCLRELIRQTHRVLFNEILKKEEMYSDRKRAWLQSLEDQEGLKRLLLGMYRKRFLRSLRLAFNRSSVDVLLFDWEKDALKTLVELDDDFLTHLDQVSYPMFDLNCSRKGGLKPMGVEMRNCALDICIKAVARTVSNFEALRAKNFQLFCLFLYPVLYILDVASDVLVAKNHFDNSDFFYFSLTILFIFGPLLAEITNKFWWKFVARGGKSTWRELLFPESITLLPRSLKSIIFALKSRQRYNRDIEKFYAEILYLRLEKDNEGQRPKWINSPNLIQGLCYSRMIQNEMYVFDWKMMECLNESAPQLLLQLYIVYQDLFLRETIDIICWIGIITSLISLSWTLHLSHYNMHYEELKNNFEMRERMMDFLSHFLMICSRFLAVSLLASMAPYLFLMGAAVYLTLLSLYLVFVSRWRKIYRLLLKNRRMLFWPAYRLFVTPYLLRLWRIDNEDDVLFHLETIAMAVCWSLISPPMPTVEGLRWILLSVIISIDLLCLPALVWVNDRIHKPARNCRGGKWNLKIVAKAAKLEYEDLS